MRNRSAFNFVLIIGIVNFFADLTYESARGIVGPFLGSLGASAAIVGFVAGFGELIGYAINMLAVPALALAGQWPLAAGLVVAERTGRAIRKPVVEAMLSHAGRSIGAGWVFGLNEALDQAGATIGPLLMAQLLHPRPNELEELSEQPLARYLTRPYWIYLCGGALIAAGFADFALIGF